MEITNYPNYLIYEDGRVLSKKARKYLKPRDNGIGYLRVGLLNNGKRKDYLIHRLVAEYYIPNPHNKKEVDHMDRNKQNNHISNLRWASPSENSQNTGKYITNKTGIKNISYHKRDNLWRYNKNYRGEAYRKYFKSKARCIWEKAYYETIIIGKG